ncbi:alpha/beta hydrolase [Flavobacterium hauense]
MENVKKKKVIFITGAFVSHACWNNWIEYFDEHGYEAIAPPWPFKDGVARVLRDRQPYDSGLASLTLKEVIDHYVAIVRQMDEKPIIIGHSLGGLIAQILINRELGVAGAAIHPIPPQGILPYEFKFLRSTWGVLGLFTSLKKTYMMSFKEFQRAFVNSMALDKQLVDYDKYAIPESKRVARGGLTSMAAVDFNKEHPPLLITSGGIDNLIPVHLIKRNFRRYKQNNSITDYREFPLSNHSVLTQPESWKLEADFVLDWLKLAVN